MGTRNTVQFGFVMAAFGAAALYAVGCGSSNSNSNGNGSPDSGGSDAAGGVAGDAAGGGNDASGAGSPDAASAADAAAVCFDAAADLTHVPACYATNCSTAIANCTANCACENALGTAITDYFTNNDPTGAASALGAAGATGSAVVTCFATESVGSCAPDAGAGSSDASTVCFDAATLPAVPACLATPCGSDITACESNCQCENALATAISDISTSNYSGAESTLSSAGSTGSTLSSCFANNIASCIP